jgi:hypothetical protein
MGNGMIILSVLDVYYILYSNYREQALLGESKCIQNLNSYFDSTDSFIHQTYIGQ